MRIKHLAALAAVAAVALVGTATPASASHTLLGAFVGTASTSGTWAPASPSCPTRVHTYFNSPPITVEHTTCVDANVWSFVSTTDIILPYDIGTTGSGRVSGSGSFTGWCGRSTGTGNFSIAGITGTVNWQSAGTIIVLVSTNASDGGGAYTAPAVAVVAARAAAGTGNCVTAPATAFDVVGVAAAVI